MRHVVSVDGALYFTKLSVGLSCSWPPSKVATKRQNIIYNVLWFISFISALCLLIPLTCALYVNHSDSLFVTQTACFMGATSNLLFKMIVYRIHIKRTQSLVHEMENFLKNAQPHEKLVIQRYVNRCWMFHAFISFVNYLTTAMGVSVPLFNPGQYLPTGAIYPFSIDSGISLYLAYIHQSIAGFQCSAGVSIDCQVALMMWYAGARIEILAQELGNVTDLTDFEVFVKKHRKLLAYAAQVSDTMSYIVLASATACGCAAIMSALQLFGYDLLGNAAYNSPWIDMPINMTRNFLFLLRRCQRPIVVSVAGFLPTLSLRFYASFLSTIFSYVTTLRLVLMSGDEN